MFFPFFVKDGYNINVNSLYNINTYFNLSLPLNYQRLIHILQVSYISLWYYILKPAEFIQSEYNLNVFLM